MSRVESWTTFIRVRPKVGSDDNDDCVYNPGKILRFYWVPTSKTQV